jgi:uncharacterized membrane protein YphA (DoxX/SURF4 family)
MEPITLGGLTATAQSDDLAGYGNSLPGVFRVYSKVIWRIEGAGERLHVMVTHAASGVRVQGYHPAGIYTFVGEQLLPGSGAASTIGAVAEFLRALAIVLGAFARIGTSSRRP